MRLWVFKRHFSTIFQLFIDLWATFPDANMGQFSYLYKYEIFLSLFYVQNKDKNISYLYK